MILRRLMRQLVSKGMRAGIDGIARRRPAANPATSNKAARSPQEQAERARLREIRQARRARRDQQQGRG